MDALTFALRMTHILSGILWAGTVFFTTLFLLPRLRRLGPNIQNPVLNSLMPIITPAMMICCVLVLGTGIALTFMVWVSLETLFATTPGWVLSVGFLATLAAAVIGFGVLAPSGMRLSQLNKAVEGRAPDSAEDSELKRLSARIETFDRLNFVFMLIAVGAMGFLRYL